ncbi:hypothetical protein DFQ26_001439, partial [Actinomortierella ambigua]
MAIDDDDDDDSYDSNVSVCSLDRHETTDDNNCRLFLKRASGSAHEATLQVKFEDGAVKAASTAISSGTLFSEHSRAPKETTKQFMQGSVVWVHFIHPWERPSQAKDVGWAHAEHSYNPPNEDGRSTCIRHCRGVWRCPEKACRYTVRPVLGKSRGLDGVPKDCPDLCKAHHTPLTWRKCKARWTVIYCKFRTDVGYGPQDPEMFSNRVTNVYTVGDAEPYIDIARRKGQDLVIIFHKGKHRHRPPPLAKDNFHSRQILIGMKIISPSTTAKQMAIGHGQCPPASEIDPAYHNISRIERIIHAQAKSQLPKCSLLATLLLDERQDTDFMKDFSCTRGQQIITLQSPEMARWARETPRSFMADSVHGIYVQADLGTSSNVSFTSAYHKLLNRFVPVVISIMLGQTAQHFKRHFTVLLQALAFPSFEDFDADFPGIAVDFSEAQLQGFHLAVA